MSNARRLDQCLCCKSKKLTPYLDLGKQPLANNYHKGERQEVYPLGVQVCETCFHNQLTHAVDNRLMFDDYIYVSGTSETLNRYFRGFCQAVMTSWRGKKPPRVLEIACNDGTLLNMFKERGCHVNGVEPAQNLIDKCESSGLTEEDDSQIYGAYWTAEVAQDLLTWEKTKYDIVIAVNVLPHVPDPQDFMEACKMMLDPAAVKQGGGIYVQTSQCDMFRNGEFDAIYHEHHSYFTVSSFGTLAYGAGLEIKEATKVPIHSQSFLFKLGPMSGTGHCDSLYDMLEVENAGGWHTVERYQEWSLEAEGKRSAFKEILESYKEVGYKLVGYGASAKANTVLNFFGISLDAIVDDNPMKCGLLTPGRDIPIVPPGDDGLRSTPVVWVMTSWNFKEEIVKKIQEMRAHYSWAEFVVSYIPDVRGEPLFDYGRP